MPIPWQLATCPSGLRGLIANQFVSGSNPLVAFPNLLFAPEICVQVLRLGRVVRHLIANQVTAVRLR